MGFPDAPINERARPAAGDREIDGTGMYVMPGLIDMHVHTGGGGKAPQAEYTYKLWMGNGITTTRGVPARGIRVATPGEGPQREERHRRASPVRVHPTRHR